MLGEGGVSYKGFCHLILHPYNLSLIQSEECGDPGFGAGVELHWEGVGGVCGMVGLMLVYHH